MSLAAATFSELCTCGRVGTTYALLLCPIDAPIPFVMLPKGQREARRMKQWDAIFDLLEARRKPPTVKRRRAVSTIRTVRRSSRLTRPTVGGVQ